MACLFATIYNSCGCVLGYNVPLQQLPNTDIASYPVTVLNVNEDSIGTANTPSEYVALWNANAANNAIGTLYIGVGAYCFYLVTLPEQVPPSHVLGEIVPGILQEDGQFISSEDNQIIIPE